MKIPSRSALLILVGAFVAGACVPNRPAAPHADLSMTSEPLRAAFNADTGRVRVVMLVSPT